MVDRRLNEIELGKITSEDIFSRDGHLLIREGTIISYELVSKLKKHKIKYRDLLVDVAERYKEPDLIEEEQMDTSINAVKNVFEDVMDTTKVTTESAIPADNIELVKKVVDALMETLSSTGDLLYKVQEIMNVDDYTYRHSVNVTILTILTAKAMGYVEKEIKEIALGALIHDIGKTLIPNNLIKKTSKLTSEEVEIMKDHPQLGYDLVKNIDDLPNSAKQIVHMHHEKMDGSGYPRGISGLEIPRYVRLVTVCDMYDAMTTTRSYRKRMPLHTALEILMRDSVYKIDPEVYRQMTANLCLYPKGLGTILSDGRIGIISEYRHSNPTRPVIQIVDFEINTGHVDIQEVDLQIDKTIFIVDTWDVNTFSKDFRNLVSDHPFYEMTEEERMRFTSSIC